MKRIDLRSDTVTAPTPEMREAMCRAEVGDDVYGDDPTMNRLEAVAAGMTGKEAALFVPSGVFGNQLALFTHCRRGSEALLGEKSHILINEGGAAAVLAGVQTRTFATAGGTIDPEEIRAKIREDDIHYPPTGVICLENALADGRVLSPDVMRDIADIARCHGVPVHLDGARVFNAAVALDTDVQTIAGHCDSVMFCLSKGLCAPVGSMLAGSRDFVARARRGRKLMGGGMRQAGILAAAGLVALEKMTARLGEDHRNAKLLAAELAKVDGIEVLTDRLDINMVFFRLNRAGCDAAELKNGLLARDIVISSPHDDGLFRLVTHYWVTEEDVGRVAQAIREIVA